MYLLEAKGLSKAFDYTLFSDVDLSVEEGESVAILGVSGSGKSTLLYILSTLLKPDHGRVLIFGEDVYSLNYDSILKIRRSFVGIIFQSHYLFKGFNARENIELSSLLATKEIDTSILKNLDIDTIMDQNTSSLSGGQQQRISIARVLNKNPKIIFADEPTGNLDSKTSKKVMDFLFNYLKEKKVAMFLVTHDTQMAKKCDRVYTLKDGAFFLC